jgi:hypothetical protein
MFRLADRVSRRELLRAGALSSLGLALPQLTPARAAGSTAKAKNCIVLFLLGGPPQHATWDPKPDAPAEVRGEFGPIDTVVPGLRVGSLFPKLAGQADKLCLLRAMSTNDNAHSSSGYYMMTGVPHAPMQVENANPGPPNDWPNLGSLVRRIRGDAGGLPGAVRLPMHIFNTDSSVWPGQDGGFLGRAADPWLFRCHPGEAKFEIPEFTLAPDVPLDRLSDRKGLLQTFDRYLAKAAEDAGGKYDRHTRQAFALLGSAAARAAFDLNKEPPATRDRYGRTHFGQSCLLARRLVEAGVSLVQVNWYRGPDEPSDAPCWDTHVREAERMKSPLAPTLDQSFAALLDDLDRRGLLQDTLVACLSEFGRTPKLNGRGGRDHWGPVFSVALAGGGIRGGQVHGSSDKAGAYPKDGKVTPQDLTATILHAMGIDPHAEYIDPLGRPLPASRGEVVKGLF